jgi:hypothetical protein
LKNGKDRLLESCIFHYKAFALSPHERLRIATTIDSLLHQGRLTKEPSWERNWVGAAVVRKLTTAMVKQALEHGTMTWDITVAKVLSIVFVAALGARTGDVTVAPLDRHKLPYLCYQDVVIKMDGGTTIDDLMAIVTIRNEKGDK